MWSSLLAHAEVGSLGVNNSFTSQALSPSPLTPFIPLFTSLRYPEFLSHFFYLLVLTSFLSLYFLSLLYIKII
jgi:hypothetical protein